MQMLPVLFNTLPGAGRAKAILFVRSATEVRYMDGNPITILQQYAGIANRGRFNPLFKGTIFIRAAIRHLASTFFGFMQDRERTRLILPFQ
jgi:hypothetical protein